MLFKKLRLILSIILCMVIFICNIKVYAVTGISAESAVVMDMRSKRVLYAKNAEKKMGMASTTKIMTALTALENGDLNSVVKVSANAASVEGSSMYLSCGEEITLENLIYGLMIVSGNDAATAIAEHISGSVDKFAELMNKKAKEIGAEDTNFDNPHGLSSDKHYTTAKDLALITSYALKNQKFREIVSTKTKKIPWQGKEYERIMTNHNKFLSMYDGCIGVKTGYTKATGRCLVTAVERNNLTFICVTLNAPDDWNDHKNLYDMSFDEFKAYKLNNLNSNFEKINANNAEENNAYATMCEELYFPVKDDEIPNIRCKIYENLNAPIDTSKAIGEIYAELNGESYFMDYLYSSEVIEEKKLVFSDTKTRSDFKATAIKIFKAWLNVFRKQTL